MSLHRERYERAKALMHQHGIDAFLILTLEDYFYFTGDVRKQPRALTFKNGDPALLVFSGEVEEANRSELFRVLRDQLGAVLSGQERVLHSHTTYTPNRQ
ncbi:MAG: aminopeptidase P family N-terminal domain-containing protein [Bacillota bacterium]